MSYNNLLKGSVRDSKVGEPKHAQCVHIVYKRGRRMRRVLIRAFVNAFIGIRFKFCSIKRLTPLPKLSDSIQKNSIQFLVKLAFMIRQPELS